MACCRYHAALHLSTIRHNRALLVTRVASSLIHRRVLVRRQMRRSAGENTPVLADLKATEHRTIETWRPHDRNAR